MPPSAWFRANTLAATQKDEHAHQPWYPSPTLPAVSHQLQLVGVGEPGRTAPNEIRWLNICNIVCLFYLHGITTDWEKMSFGLWMTLICRATTPSLSVPMKAQGSSAPFTPQRAALHPTMAKYEWHLFHQLLEPVVAFFTPRATQLLLFFLSQFCKTPPARPLGLPAQHGQRGLPSFSFLRSGFASVSTLACAAELADHNVKFH